MSLKEASMAPQAVDVHHGEASPSSSPHAISFVKSIDRKARSYLKTLERSFSFSTTESKGEDPSTMTIEFLRARLQAQRAEYRAEKQTSQLLAKKVLELEQRLSFEIEQRRKAECNNMQVISPNYCGSSSSRLKDTHSYIARDFMDSKLKDNSSGEDDPSDWCSEIAGNEGHQDGHGVFLVSPSSLWHRWESLRHERQQRGNQHVISQFNEGINAASVLDTESFTLNHRDLPREATSCGEYALSMEELEDIADQESTKFHTVATDRKQESWNTSYRTDPQSLRVSNTYAIPAIGCEKPSEAGHGDLHDNPNRQASTLYDADESFKYDCSQQHMHAIKATTHNPNNYFASPIDSCQNYQLKFSQSPINPLDKMVSSNSSPGRGVHVSIESHAKRPELGTTKSTDLPQMFKSMRVGHDRVFEYIVANSNTNKKIKEERASLRKLSNDESKNKYMKEILSPECVTDYEISTLQQSSRKVQMQKANATFKTCRSFSSVETGRLQGHRMSLDGGLERLQKAGKEICRALEDGESAKFRNNVMNNYYSVS